MSQSDAKKRPPLTVAHMDITVEYFAFLWLVACNVLTRCALKRVQRARIEIRIRQLPSNQRKHPKRSLPVYWNEKAGRTLSRRIPASFQT